MRIGKFSFHLDHPWAEDVVKYGAPLRLYIGTPWIFIQLGEKSQVYEWKTKKYTDRWSYITVRPRQNK
jgi:hypothetical protein